MKYFLFIILFGLLSYTNVDAQIVGDLETDRISELDAVETPFGTFVVCSMEIIDIAAGEYRVLIHRSIDNGFTWGLVDSLEVQGVYETIGDPVITIDGNGKLYLVVMQRLLGSSLNIHLTLYVSNDDGETWEVESHPYFSSEFADTPHLMVSSSGELYLTYTEYHSSVFGPSKIHFIKSSDEGQTWTSPILFDVVGPPSLTSVIGANFGISGGHQISLAYGDYYLSDIYYVSSLDSGITWTSPIQISGIVSFAANKVISHSDQDYLGILTHKAHLTESDIFCSYSLNNGLTWQSYLLAQNSSYAEGFMDDEGNVHITYNQLSGGIFTINYVYSTDSFATFSPPAIIYSAPFSFAGEGESQSMILGNDGMIHLTFTDWSDNSNSKHLIFEPFNFNTVSYGAQNHGSNNSIELFPNPFNQTLFLEVPLQMSYGGRWDISTLNGKMIRQGLINSSETRIELPSLLPGLYLLRVYSNNIIIIKKVLKN